MQDTQFFVKAHQKMGKGVQHNFTKMRLLQYPPLPPEDEIKPGQLRCGEHVDSSTISLIFQDPNGGLQVYQYNYQCGNTVCDGSGNFVFTNCEANTL